MLPVEYSIGGKLDTGKGGFPPIRPSGLTLKLSTEPKTRDSPGSKHHKCKNQLKT